MSQITKRWPWRQTAMKIPEMANKANIFFWASGAALRQRSRHMSIIFCLSSFSAMLSHAISSVSALRIPAIGDSALTIADGPAIGGSAEESGCDSYGKV